MDMSEVERWQRYVDIRDARIKELEEENGTLRNGLHAIKRAGSKGEAHRIAVQVLGRDKGRRGLIEERNNGE